MKARLISLLIIIMLIGCAGVKPIPQDTLNQITRIGAVSVLDNDLIVRYVGPTIFTNFEEQNPVPEWKIDDYVTENLRKVISRNTKMSYQVVEYEKGPLLAIYEKGHHKEQLEKELAAISKKNGLDAIVFVKRGRFQDPILHDQHVDGYGLYQRNVLISKMSAVYLVAHVTIYETKQMTPLCKFHLIDDRRIKNEYSTKSTDNMSYGQLKAIETWLKSAIKKELKEGLTKVGILKPM